MLANYSRGETLIVAIEKTFGGEHPCGLCKVVKTGRTEEQNQQMMKIMVKLEAVIGMTPQLPPPHGTEWKYLVSLPEFLARSLAPPTPPPQAV